jgi:spore maturation protein CgeB
MRIFYVAMRWDYGDHRRGPSFEQMNFASALEGMGHEVMPFDFMEEKQRYGRQRMNKRLLAAAEERQADVAFFCLFENEIKKSTIRAVSALGTPTVNWFCDDHWRFDNFSRFYAPAFDWVTTTSEEALPKYARIGYRNVILAQWACNRYAYRRVSDEKRYDISFVGQPHGNRRELIASLHKAGIDVHCFGYGWPAGRVGHDQMIEIFSTSRLNLNPSNSSTALDIPQLKGRVFEVPGCGGFLLTEPAAHLEHYLEPGRECVVYESRDDLVDKTRYYLAHEEERRAIELAGEARVLRDHTYDNRFDAIFTAMGLSEPGQ